jgi:hypothetical protein
MRNKVSSDWLSNYVNVTRPVLEIFKMARYFPDSPRISDQKISLSAMSKIPLFLRRFSGNLVSITLSGNHYTEFY